jgi:protein ImuA
MSSAVQKSIPALRARLASMHPSSRPRPVFTTGAPGVDAVVGAGLCRGALHEVAAAGTPDAPAAAGFVTGLCLRASAMPDAPAGLRVVWIRQGVAEAETGKLYPPGLAQAGFSPRGLVQVRLRDAKDLLRAGLEAVACEALSALVIEPFGNPPLFDLTATRKLALAAEKSAIAVFVFYGSATGRTSAAMTRWQVRSAPSRPLAANAPGLPAFEVTLLRNRAGREGPTWRLEWNHGYGVFDEAEALPGAVASLPVNGPAAQAGSRQWRRAG